MQRTLGRLLTRGLRRQYSTVARGHGLVACCSARYAEPRWYPTAASHSSHGASLWFSTSKQTNQYPSLRKSVFPSGRDEANALSFTRSMSDDALSTIPNVMSPPLDYEQQRRRDIEALLNDTDSIASGGSTATNAASTTATAVWSDEKWSSAARLLLTQFPIDATLYLQIGRRKQQRGDIEDESRAYRNNLTLLHLLCRFRPKSGSTYQLMHTFVELVTNVLKEHESTVQGNNHSEALWALQKQRLHQKQKYAGGESGTHVSTPLVTFSAHVYDALRTVTRHRYWHPHSAPCFSCLVRLAARAGMAAESEAWLLQHARDSRIVTRRIEPPNRYDYTTVVQAWAAQAAVETVPSSSTGATKVTPVVVVVAGAEAAKRADLLIRHWHKVYTSTGKPATLKPTEAAYTSWIVSHTRAGAISGQATAAARTAQDILREIWDRAPVDDLWPSVTMYNTVIHAWAMAGQAEQAERVLHDLCEKALQHYRYCVPDATSFTTCIAAWAQVAGKHDDACSSGAPERAERLLRLQHEFAVSTGMESVQPNAVTVTAVLNCWAKSNKPEAPSRAEAILRRMQEHAALGNSKLRPTAITYNICMNAWARSNRNQPEVPQRVEALFRELHAEYVASSYADRLRPDQVTYMTRINAWERNSYFDVRTVASRAASVLDEMLASPMEAMLYPTSRHFNRVISAWSRCGDAAAATTLLERMLDDFLTRDVKTSCPDLSSFHFVMSAWSTVSSPDAARRTELFLNQMEELSRKYSSLRHLQPNVVSFNTCLAAWARSGDKHAFDHAGQLCQRMSEANIPRDHFSYGALLQIVSQDTFKVGNANLCQSQLAQKIVTEMNDSGVQPNDILVRLASRCGVSFG